MSELGCASWKGPTQAIGVGARSTWKAQGGWKTCVMKFVTTEFGECAASKQARDCQTEPLRDQGHAQEAGSRRSDRRDAQDLDLGKLWRGSRKRSRGSDPSYDEAAPSPADAGGCSGRVQGGLRDAQRGDQRGGSTCSRQRSTQIPEEWT